MRKIFLCFVACSGLLATEVDSFTLRDPKMRDALGELDGIMQNNFKQALEHANSEQSCDPKIFEKAFHGTIKGVFWTQFESDIENSQTLDKKTLSRADSIYRDVTILEGTALYMAQLGYIMRIGDLYVGSDKFGHFLETGYEYYLYPSLDEALEYGEMTERTYFGLTTTGVYSYGDLAANLDGYEFWRNLAHYTQCENNVWTQKNLFSWADYLNAAWDEGINCSYYKNEHITKSVQEQITKLGMSCPVKTGHCSNMIQHYGYSASHAVTEACF
ncbi:MAG: hypothetical protein WCK49_02230 [Myxococcaceae bacterium]